MNKLLSILVVIAAHIASPLSFGETFTVCSRGCDFTNIPDAVSAASSGDVILISAGEYPTFWGQHKDLTYLGEAGTVITSGIPGPGGCSSSPQSHHVRAIGNATFENIEFKWLHRGGIDAIDRSLVFRNCTFRECTSESTAASCARASTLLFEDCLFTQNVHVASSSTPNQLYGGLIEGFAVITGCRFQSNCGMITSGSASLQGSVICDHREGGEAYCIFGQSNSLELLGCAVLSSQTECFIEDRDRPYTATGCYFACNNPDANTSYFVGGGATLIHTSICNESCDDWNCDNQGGSIGSCDPDCNGNGVVDVIELINGQASDYDENWVPDACECLADLNSDGSVGAADLGLLVAAWGDAKVLPQADINRDGNIDAIDLGLLLGAWGACP